MRLPDLLRLGLLLALLGWLTVGATAVEVGNLYSAQTIVTGTEEPERTRGFRAGLADVFIKLTGNAWLAEDARLAPLLDRPYAYVEWFEYEDRMKSIPVHDEQGTRDRPHFLRMRFKQAEIEKALAALGLAKWPADRPLVNVRLVIVTANGHYLLRSSGPEGYGQRAVLIETAERRGIPILLPDGVVGEDWADLDNPAEHDSEAQPPAPRGARALLSGELSLGEEGYWDIRWQLRWQDRDWSWAMHKVTFDTALRNGLHQTAMILSGSE